MFKIALWSGGQNSIYLKWIGLLSCLFMSDNLCRDEQYKQMWAELENLIRAHVDSSPKHQRVLDCPLKCKKPSDDVKSSPSSTTEAGQETNTDQYYAWKELDRSGVRVQGSMPANLQSLMKMHLNFVIFDEILLIRKCIWNWNWKLKLNLFFLIIKISENDGEGKTNQKEDHPLLKNPDSALMILSLKAKVGGQWSTCI